MNYIKYFIDEKNQTVLIVSGCSRRCKNCPNPKTQDYRSGNRFDDNAKKNLFELLSKSDGIVLSGGDPMYISNRSEVIALMKEVRKNFPDKPITLRTGYSLSQLKSLPAGSEVCQLTDKIIEKK